MRKIVSRIIILSFLLMTIYIVVVWEPSEELNKNIKYENKVTREDKDSYKNISDGELSKNSIVTSSFQIFKMPIEEIIENLSISDRIELSHYVYKLQEVDRKRIIDWLKQNDLEGIEKAYSLIQVRLSSEDFNKLNSILEPYVNINLLKIEV